MTERVRNRPTLMAALAAASLLAMGSASAAADDLPSVAPAPGVDRAPAAWRVYFGAADASAGQAAAPAPEPTFLQRIEVTGFVDGYYGWNTNRIGPTALRNFDVNHNEFSLNMAEVAVEKKATDDSRAGFRMDFMAGQALDFINAFEPGGTGFLKYVEQAYVSYLAPVGKGLSIDFGKFVTPAGAEVIETKDNYNYSRGLLFSLAIPYYHMGARVSYPVTDRVTVNGFFVNGWNDVRDNNSGKTFGASVAVKPGERFSVTQLYMVGPEQADENDDIRHLFDTVASYTLSPKMTLLGNFDYGRDEIAGQAVDWYGVAAYLRYQASDRWTVAPRYEWFRDDDGYATGVPQDVQELTLTSEHTLAPGLLARLEWRTDFSNQSVFVNSDAEAKKNQSTITVGLIYAFSSKQ